MSDKLVKTMKTELFFNEKQLLAFVNHAGCDRYVYNYFLNLRTTTYQESKTRLSKEDCTKILTQLRKEKDFLANCHSQALQSAVFKLDKAFDSFFAGRARYPKFKTKRHSKQSMHLPQNIVVDFENDRIKMPVFGWVKAKTYRKLFANYKAKTATITSKNGRYYVSISFDCGTKKKMRKSVDATKIITGDLGLKTFLTTNKGEKIETPRFYNKNVKLIKRLNRKLDRSLRQNNPDKYEPDFINKKGIKCKGMVKKGAKNFLKTKNYLRLEKKRNLILEKQANQLEDHHKKLARKLVDESQAMGLEDLAVKNMIKNPRLARHIQGVAWGKFIRYVKVFCEEDGKPFVSVDRFYPSSKLCSVDGCDYKYVDLKLTVREWVCPKCKTIHDRDENATMNLEIFTIQRLQSEKFSIKKVRSAASALRTLKKAA